MVETKPKEKEVYQLFDEYVHLSNSSTLSFDQEKHLEAILEETINNPQLDQLINQFEVESLSTEDQQELLNVRTRIAEYLLSLDD